MEVGPSYLGSVVPLHRLPPLALPRPRRPRALLRLPLAPPLLVAQGVASPHLPSRSELDFQRLVVAEVVAVALAEVLALPLAEAPLCQPLARLLLLLCSVALGRLSPPRHPPSALLVLGPLPPPRSILACSPSSTIRTVDGTASSATSRRWLKPLPGQTRPSRDL